MPSAPPPFVVILFFKCKFICRQGSRTHLAPVPQEDEYADDGRSSQRSKGSNPLYQSVPELTSESEPLMSAPGRRYEKNNKQQQQRRHKTPAVKNSASQEQLTTNQATADAAEKKKVKNVRFSNVRTQSMGYLESTIPLDDNDHHHHHHHYERVKSGQRSKAQRPKAAHAATVALKSPRQLWGSGGELCTDEFLIQVNYASATPPSPRHRRRNHAYVNTVAAAPAEAPSPEMSRRSTSLSSPDLVFDPVSNTVRIVYERRDENQGLYHRAACRDEGTMRIHAPSCNGRDCYRFAANESDL